MSLHDVIIADASAVFCNADDFAESASYNGTRSIDVIISRDGYETAPDTATETPVFEVQVVNDSTLGISSSELNVGGDKLTFAERVGMTATERTITRLVGHDEGMLILECR